MKTVLVTSRSFSSGSVDVEGLLTAAGLEVERGPATHDLEAITDSLSRCVAWIAGTGPVTEEHLSAAPHLRAIARYGVGTDAVDLKAATARGVLVTNTPGANSSAVADHTLALLLALLRGVLTGDRRVRQGSWQVDRTHEMAFLVVGLIGFGRIGRQVAGRLAGFGTTVIATDPLVLDEEMRVLGVEPALLRIPAEVDVVSLHAPGALRLIDAHWLSTARPGLLLVNTARASLVDEVAVANALRDGGLGGYAADSLSSESDHRISPLLADDIADRVIFTPHSAAQSVEAVDRMGAMSTEAVLDVLAGRRPKYLVSETAG